MIPQLHGRVFMHPNQLMIEKAACRVEPVAEGEYLTTFYQTVVVNNRLPEEGIFYADNPVVKRVLAAQEGADRRRAQLAFYKFDQKHRHPLLDPK